MNTNNKTRDIRFMSLVTGCSLLLLFFLSGCGLSGFQTNLSAAMLNNPDPETVKEALPTYLVATDALIAADPEEPEYLQAGAELYSVYAVLFINDPDRSRRLVTRAKSYGEQAICHDVPITCNLSSTDFEGFVKILNQLSSGSVPSLYSYTISWLSWAQFNSDNWEVIADLPKFQAALSHIITLQEDYRQGSAHVYLGILKSLRPPSVGGNPDEGRRHFERAIELSSGKNLSAKVELARYYARLVYDRELHDRVLQEVLDAPLEAEGLTLQNALAKNQARELLKNADNHF